MSKLSYQDLVEGLRHNDLFVRSGSLLVLAEAYAENKPEASLAVLDMLEKHGWANAFVEMDYALALPVDQSIAKRILKFTDNPDLEECTYDLEDPVETLIEWIGFAPPAVLQEILPEFESKAEDDDEINLAKYKISLLDSDAEKCLSLIEKSLASLVKDNPTSPFQLVSHAKALIDRLADLNAINDELALEWINTAAEFEDEDEPALEDLKVCAGFEMAKAAKIRVPLERCLECFGHRYEWLSDAVGESLIANADEALLADLLDQYPKVDEDTKFELLTVFEKVRFPGFEDKIRDLASLEKDISNRVQFGTILGYYGTDPGVKYARETAEWLSEDIDSADILDSLYAIRILKGEESAELDQWREILNEIHLLTKKLLEGELGNFNFLRD